MILSRQALSTFDVKATSASLPAGLKPDEFMFDWTALPADAVASIYSPVLSADAIISTAGSMYGTQPFTRIDANTLGCDCKGIAFMPIPAGSGNYAGLLTVALPNTISKGDKFTVTVTQITNAQGASRRAKGGLLTWRKILGSFQLAIKIETKAESLPKIEQNLSLLRWILSTIPTTNRWYPVLARYVGAVVDQVTNLGGDPSAIPPSATGTWPGAPFPAPGKTLPPPGVGKPLPPPGISKHHPKSHTGKIAELLFDHFGDFEGFTLETESGETFTFFSHESHMEELVHQAWAERLRVTVVPEPQHHERPRQIMLHQPFRH
jgi:hypothetical protein